MKRAHYVVVLDIVWFFIIKLVYYCKNAWLINN